MDYTINKTNVECYKLRQSSTSEYWADITIDAGKSSGRISIASDYGNWQNSWQACGSNFKEFLLKLQMDYVASKFNCDKQLDKSLTIKTFGDYLDDYKRDFNDAEYKSVLKEIDSLHSVSKAEFVNYIHNNCPGIMKLYEQRPDIQSDVDPHFKAFWRNTWPAFLVELKKELEADQQPVNN